MTPTATPVPNGSESDTTTQSSSSLPPPLLPLRHELVFYLNDSKKIVPHPDPTETLAQYLRRIGLTGTKIGCDEGGCGSCTVLVSSYSFTKQRLIHLSVNACLAPLCSVDGKHVVTVEGLRGPPPSRNLHPAQSVIADAHGSQCGYCTPGIVMSLYAHLVNHPEPKIQDIEDAFDGNLCRCTGYRSILEGATSLAIDHPCASKSQVDLKECMKPMGGFPDELLKFTANLTAPPAYAFEKNNVRWYRPNSLTELLAIKAAVPHAKLVNGNTEIGIEMKFKGMAYQVLIYPTDIPELCQIARQENGVVFGGGVTIADFEEHLTELCQTLEPEKTSGFKALLANTKYFAGHQVRHVGVLAGNICTASPISDLNPVFLALNALVTLQSVKGGERKVLMNDFFTGYRRTALQPQEVLVSIFVPFTEKGEFVKAYKQARRRDDDIAIVNACLRIRLDNQHVVSDCSFAFGGLSPTTTRALSTEAKLRGQAFNSAACADAAVMLLNDFNLPGATPGGQVEFRKTLALSFFKKFELYVLFQLKGLRDSNCASALEDFARKPSHGSQAYEIPVEPGVVGENVKHTSADKQVTGEALYCDDLPPLHNEVTGVIVASTKAHAKILSVDYSEALKMPGVIGYVDASDLPPTSDATGHSHNANAFGPVFKDEELFASKEVVCVGQMIGFLVAETRAQARAALPFVKVSYEVLPHILTIEEAIAAQSFMPIQRIIKTGAFKTGVSEADKQAILKQADFVVEGETRISAQEHFYLETQASLVNPGAEDGEVEVFASTQNPSEMQHLVAHVLGLPSNRVVCRVKRLGGGFGGKETRSAFLTCALAVAARKFGRPVRCMLSRDEDMSMTGTRHPFLGKYKVGFTREKLVFLELDIFSNGGCSYDLSLAVLERGMTHNDNVYKIPNMNLLGRICKTNLPSNTAFRGFGGPQGLMIAEQWMNHVTDYLQTSPLAFRSSNFYANNDVTHFSMPLENFHIGAVWDDLVTSSSYHERRVAVDAFNRVNTYKKRGLAVMPTKFGLAFTARFLNQAGALVHVYVDGSVRLTHGGTEMGQGLHTKMIQVCAQAFDIPMSKIHLSETRTDTVANTSATAASVSSDINGQAVLNACNQIMERLKPFQTDHPGASWEEIVKKAYFDRVNLSANGFYKTPDLSHDWESNTGRMFSYFTYGAACTEVEIDTLTGDHNVLRSDVVMDIGRSMNPAIDIGQIEGAFVQGQGWCTLEEPLVSPQTGTLLTRGPGLYKIPGFKDIPEDFRVTIVKRSRNVRAIHSSKAVGEPPLFLGASVFFAIKDAIKAARIENGAPNGYFRLDCPATSERIRLACGDKLVQMAATPLKEGEKPWSYAT